MPLVTACGFSAAVESSQTTSDGATADMQQAGCDLDGDGACDDQTWRCGTSPNSPGSDPLFGDVNNEALWAHEVSLAGKGRFVVAAAGKSLAVALRYDWRVDCPGASCQAQVVFGVVASGFDAYGGCVVDRQMIDRDIAWSQNGGATITVPAASGIYDVRLDIAKQPACGAAWSAPGSSHAIAKICVP